MQHIIIFLVFVFGTIIGSFLNVVILRYGTGKNVFGPRERSMCFSCGKKLEWYELIPVLSFLILRARCTGCRSPISWQYPLVEVATGLVFVGIFAKNFQSFFIFDSYIFLISDLQTVLTQSLIQAIIWSILIVITVYDLRHKIIPDGLVYAFSALALTLAFFFPINAGGSFAGAVLAGVALFCVFAGLWFVSSGRWLGFGDAKLVLGVGFLLGLVGGVSAIVLAFWIGAVVSIIVIFIGRLSSVRVVQCSRLLEPVGRLTMKSEIPFAPFIILGTLISFFCYLDIIGISVFL